LYENKFQTKGFIVPLIMIKRQEILLEIKRIVNSTEPKATVILFGSYARGDNKKFSDIDILILVDKDKINKKKKKRIKYPLYDLEFDTGNVISPIVFSRKDWESRHSITPFYKNVKREGILL